MTPVAQVAKTALPQLNAKMAATVIPKYFDALKLLIYLPRVPLAES